jgi:hypothetical protein
VPTFQDDPVESKAEGAAVIGESATWMGVYGKSSSTTGGFGVMGDAVGTGVTGVSQTWIGVYGETHGTDNGPAGVWGEGKDGGSGVKGQARANGAVGVGGWHVADSGVGGAGVFGHSLIGHGVHGQTDSQIGGAGVTGENTANGPGVVGHGVNGPGIYATSDHGSAAVFDGKVEVHGDVEVKGDVKLLIEGQDVAELFETAVGAAPGTVMSLDADGQLTPSTTAYDRKVVGVVAGAGTYRPAVILGSGGGDLVRPIAMVGKVWCLADAGYGAIGAGDLLTTSPHAGHAMRADDPARAFGAVLGKALGSLDDGVGLVPVVVALQ